MFRVKNLAKKRGSYHFIEQFVWGSGTPELSPSWPQLNAPDERHARETQTCQESIKVMCHSCTLCSVFSCALNCGVKLSDTTYFLKFMCGVQHVLFKHGYWCMLAEAQRRDSNSTDFYGNSLPNTEYGNGAYS